MSMQGAKRLATNNGRRAAELKIMTVVGARPNFMKAAPLVAAIARRNQNGSRRRPGSRSTIAIRHLLVHTGQHYGQLMSDSFFADLDLPAPEIYLGVGSGSHAVQTAEIMRKFEEVLLAQRPDVLVVVGDVNSTLACALVGAKAVFDGSANRPLIVHVEAGLRSFDRTMPEEINRILTDQVSDLLFVTEESGVRNLAREGVAPEKVHFVGNTMIDTLLSCRDKAKAAKILDLLELRNGARNGASHPAVSRYALLTLHRPANVDNRQAFVSVLEGLDELAAECPVVFPAHPRTQKRIGEFDLGRYFDSTRLQQQPEWAGSGGSIRMIDPLGYLDFLCLMMNARLVVTDSGGIQEETTCLGVPCVTVRDNTERPITVKLGTNVLAGVTQSGIREAVRRQLGSQCPSEPPALWDGRTADRILRIVVEEWERNRSPLQSASAAVSGPETFRRSARAARSARPADPHARNASSV